ncbi:MAG TPA: hypothetical protein DC049_15805, partial [Spirochaetia bacterium]|nr:hypothetical protein [Spirochaetia bacterium]
IVMLHEKGFIDTAIVKKLRPILEKTKTEKGYGGEDYLKQNLPDHDEDTAAAVNFGRTLQEPMARLAMRESLLYLFDELLLALENILNVAAENLDTIMAGQSHWSHAQPTTFAAYLLSVHDQLARGLEQMETAYKHVNRNSAGCGACSGTGWPVNRERITELLGFDETIELTYDCEAAMDERLTTLFAASNIAVSLSRTAIDFNVWTTAEWNLFYVDMAWRGVSSFMPQKANPGNKFERTRIACNEVLGKMMNTIFSFKNEPIQDILPVCGSDKYVMEGLAHLERALGIYRCMLQNTKPDRARMKKLLKEGYSGAPDLAVTLIRKKNFGGRSAHRICATMVRIARERNIKPYECTGVLLDEAARISNDPEPRLTDSEVQDSMSLDNFFIKHCNLGDPNPDESARLLEKRRVQLKIFREKQTARRESIKAAMKKLDDSMEAICRN